MLNWRPFKAGLHRGWSWWRQRGHSCKTGPNLFRRVRTVNGAEVFFELVFVDQAIGINTRQLGNGMVSGGSQASWVAGGVRRAGRGRGHTYQTSERRYLVPKFGPIRTAHTWRRWDSNPLSMKHPVYSRARLSNSGAPPLITSDAKRVGPCRTAFTSKEVEYVVAVDSNPRSPLCREAPCR